LPPLLPLWDSIQIQQGIGTLLLQLPGYSRRLQCGRRSIGTLPLRRRRQRRLLLLLLWRRWRRRRRLQ
jgi:hypothetical protein